VIDNDDSYRAALAEAITATRDLELVGTADGVRSGLDAARRLQPRLVVVDVRMPEGGGSRVARELCSVSPNSVVLALSVHDDPDSVEMMRAAGAEAYIAKGGPVEDLLRAMLDLCR
jgi:DNA-binding NarL/FixJ family response regulator